MLLSNVEELLDPATGTWDVQLVRDIFSEQDASIILSIPVHAGMENRVAWHFDKRGAFSVISVYKLYRKEQMITSRRGGASASNPDPGLDSLWRKIWDVPCTKKIKQFL